MVFIKTLIFNQTSSDPEASPVYPDTFMHRLLLICLISLSAPLYAESADPDQEKTGAKPEAADKKPSDLKLEVKVTGIEDELLKNAEAYLELRDKKDEPSLTPAWIEHLHKQSPEEIQASLEPFGYYNAQVESSLEQDDKGTWIATYAVTPGPQVKITQVEVLWSGSGAEEPELQKMVGEFPLKVGDPVLHSAYDEAKDALLEKASVLGYVDVTIEESKLIVYPEKNTAEIKLHIQTGEKYYVGDIVLHQDVLNQEFIMRYLDDVQVGDPYSQAGMLEIQRDFIESGYYSLVDVKPKFDQVEDYHVPVDVRLEPANRQKYSFGLGFDTDIGLNLNARWQHRRLNKAGHNADALVKLSEKERRIQASYWVPIKNPKIHKIGYTAKYVYEQTDSTERSTFDLEAAYYTKWQKWISKLFTEFKNERYTAGQEDEELINMVSIGASVDRTAFEQAIYPRRGWKLYSELRGSPGLVFENSAYIRAHIKGRFYVPIFKKGRVILRGEFGTATVENFEMYPLSLRFFAGGDNSVRGYEWKSLGPKDKFGEVIGGTHVITGTFEYNHQVAESWLAAGFVDTGNAYDNDFDKTYTGAGFGARWLSPVGIVRADLAWPLVDDDDDIDASGVRLHIGFEVNL
jgi:translocation and assembly module TamA